MKETKTENMYACMDANIHSNTKKHTIHTCKKERKKRNNICRDESWLLTINLN